MVHGECKIGGGRVFGRKSAALAIRRPTPLTDKECLRACGVCAGEADLGAGYEENLRIVENERLAQCRRQ